MADMHLHGAEDVRRAANTISGAADTMSRAVGNLDDVLRRHQSFLDEFIIRFEGAVEEMKKCASTSPSA